MLKMGPQKYLLLLLFLAVIIAPVLAIGISPSSVNIPYEAGKDVRLRFTAINHADAVAVFEVYIEGELANYITPEQTKLVMRAKERKDFYVRLHMPENLEPGTRPVQVGVMEASNQASGALSARAGVKSNVEVDVPYPNKYLVAGMAASYANVGEPVHFEITVQNKGMKTIDKVSGSVNIFEGRNKIGFSDSNSIYALAPGQKSVLAIDWQATQIGSLIAVADIFYDELSITAATKFKVGDATLTISSVDFGTIRAGNVGKISVSVQNEWNKPMSGANAELVISRNQQGVARIAGKPFSIDAQGRHKEEFYWDTAGLEPGVYDGKVILHFLGKTTEQGFKIGLAGTRQFDNVVYVAIVALLATLFVLFALYSKKQKRRSK